ncbi:amidohydrolase family protein [Microbacterium murale]|uniref:Metal-dependent hydrolase n=1 Tax=Microbacterium murale TaxID=1081040 RepID=A0ABQ1RA81_9MICO|nr:amidohydrolase family protein [Microbacterium murale]GGD63719.1 metal-dependent hydrolase [Microbacterium murale]
MRVLDSHLHLWDPSLLDYPWLSGPLRARFAADEVASAVGAVDGERGFVFVQADCIEAQYLDEIDWVASLATQVGVRGIVAGARLDRGAATVRHLDAVAERPLVVGVRHLLQGEADGFAATPAFRAGAAALVERDLTFDACVRGEAQMRDVIRLAADMPELRIVLDHLGKPAVGTAAASSLPSAEWADAMGALAVHSQVFCKLSGLPAEAGGSWSPAQMEPFFDAALEAFGPDRLMIGSDWPVSAVTASGWNGGADAALDAGAIGAWTDAVTSWAVSRAVDVDAILWSNAERFYRV